VRQRTALERIIRNASERIIIHSTFVTDAGADAILPLLLQASAKGVLIDVLWGQDDVGHREQFVSGGGAAK
jgi:cardiolipin synthase